MMEYIISHTTIRFLLLSKYIAPIMDSNISPKTFGTSTCSAILHSLSSNKIHKS